MRKMNEERNEWKIRPNEGFEELDYREGKEEESRRNMKKSKEEKRKRQREKERKKERKKEIKAEN